MRYRLLAILLATLASPKLLACSPRLTVPHVLDPAEQKLDRNPPNAGGLGVLKVVRGRGPTNNGDGSITINTCAQYGSIQVVFSWPPSDDRTPTTKLGVTWRIVGGNRPAGLREPTGFEQLSPRQIVAIDWDDGSSDVQEPLEFEIVVIVRDLAGNESRSQPLRISDPGTQ